MNAIERLIIEAVRDGKVTSRTRHLALRYLEKADAAPEKPAIPSVQHHKKERRAEEHQAESVSLAVRDAIIERSRIDHRGRVACEACHRSGIPLEGHHLEMGSGNRTNEPHLVMLICVDCHTQGPNAAHRRVRWFAINIVQPWIVDHGFDPPNRKEYR